MPLPKNYTWGCPPGYLCKPPHTDDREDCTVEAGLPAESYTCSPSNCVVAPPLVINQTTVEGHVFTYSQDYYNLDPEDFGLSYKILQGSGGSQPSDSTTSGISPFSPSKPLPAAQGGTGSDGSIPPLCYNICNDVGLEAQSMGKTPELCQPDSAFSTERAHCKSCIELKASNPSEAYSQRLLPSFSQFLNYCDESSTTNRGGSMTLAQPTAAITVSEVAPSSSTFTSAPGDSTTALIPSPPTVSSTPEISLAAPTTSSQGTSLVPTETAQASITQTVATGDPTIHVVTAIDSSTSFTSISAEVHTSMPFESEWTASITKTDTSIPSTGFMTAPGSSGRSEDTATSASTLLSSTSTMFASQTAAVLSETKDSSSETKALPTTNDLTRVGGNRLTTAAGDQTTTDSTTSTNAGSQLNSTPVSTSSHSSLDDSMSQATWTSTTITARSSTTATEEAASSSGFNMASSGIKVPRVGFLSLFLAILMSLF